MQYGSLLLSFLWHALSDLVGPLHIWQTHDEEIHSDVVPKHINVTLKSQTQIADLI